MEDVPTEEQRTRRRGPRSTAALLRDDLLHRDRADLDGDGVVEPAERLAIMQAEAEQRAVVVRYGFYSLLAVLVFVALVVVGGAVEVSTSGITFTTAPTAGE